MQTWNIEVFVDVLKELVPSLNWAHVIQELDHPGFLIKDPKGLHAIVFAYLKAEGNTPFPIQSIYKPWSNTMGQVNGNEIEYRGT